MGNDDSTLYKLVVFDQVGSTFLNSNYSYPFEDLDCELLKTDSIDSASNNVVERIS